MGYASFSLSIPVGLDINQALNFNPTAVIVSNYSPYYIYFADAVNFCPPWTSGAVIPLSHATRGRASWSFTPFGTQTITTPPAGVTYIANLVFSEDPNLTLSGGTLVIVPPDTRSVSFSATPGVTITTGTLSYPTIGCRVDNNTGTWYQIGTTGFLVPPFTTGFTVDLLPAITSLIVAPTTPPYGVPNNTSGTEIKVTLYAGYIGNSSGNTVIVTYYPSLKQFNTKTSVAIDNPSITLPVTSITGNLLIAVIAWCDPNVKSVTNPSGWTTIFNSGSTATGCWIGYKISTGDANIAFTLSAITASISMIIAEYKDFLVDIFQSAAAAGNSASVLPVITPMLIIGVSAYGGSTLPGSLTSSDTTVKASITETSSAYRTGVGISDLINNTISSKTVTLTWSGVTALRTAILIGE